MAVLNPLSAIDAMLASAIVNHVDVIAVVDPSKIQVWDRGVDIRGEVQDAPDMGKRIWILPTGSPTDFEFSSGSTKFTRNYRIGFGVGGIKLEGLRKIEWALIKAMAHLHNLLNASAAPLNQASFAPLMVESVSIGTTDPEREPIFDPQEWTDICEVTVVATTADSNLLPPS